MKRKYTEMVLVEQGVTTADLIEYARVIESAMRHPDNCLAHAEQLKKMLMQTHNEIMRRAQRG